MIGQNKLKSLIRALTYSTFPNVVLLVGEEGSGKHTLIKEEIQPILNIESKNITDSISYEGIGEIYLSPIPYLYTIEIDFLSTKKFNVLLKFLEEPPENCKIILLASTLATIIPTLLNRCQIWVMEPYSDEELLNFTNNKTALIYMHTPGKLLNTSFINDLPAMIELSKNIILKYKNVTLSNLLSVSSRIDWDKTDSSKFNAKLFNDIFIFESAELFKSRHINEVQYNIVHEYVNNLVIKRNNFERCLVQLKFYGY